MASLTKLWSGSTLAYILNIGVAMLYLEVAEEAEIPIFILNFAFFANFTFWIAPCLDVKLNESLGSKQLNLKLHEVVFLIIACGATLIISFTLIDELLLCLIFAIIGHYFFENQCQQYVANGQQKYAILSRIIKNSILIIIIIITTEPYIFFTSFGVICLLLSGKIWFLLFRLECMFRKNTMSNMKRILYLLIPNLFIASLFTYEQRIFITHDLQSIAVFNQYIRQGLAALGMIIGGTYANALIFEKRDMTIQTKFAFLICFTSMLCVILFFLSPNLDTIDFLIARSFYENYNLFVWYVFASPIVVANAFLIRTNTITGKIEFISIALFTSCLICIIVFTIFGSSPNVAKFGYLIVNLALFIILATESKKFDYRRSNNV